MTGLYVHIPFCRSKCSYCDFYSTPDTGMMERYVDAIDREWLLRESEIPTDEITTVYLGGGTPSMLGEKLLAKILRRINALCALSSMKEVTLEANPEDITKGSIEFYRSIGVNRISIGIQSFSSAELKALGRMHSSEAAFSALDVLSDSGINYSADLIYGVPGQTPEKWEKNINTLLDYRPPHFSAYLLSFEPGTKLYARMLTGKVKETPEEIAEEMYGILCSCAGSRGYNHYEVSNFALPGMHARHNSAYWTYTPYLGLGVSAHSFDGVTRRYNPLNIKAYLSAIDNNTPAFIVDDENESNKFNDYIITSMRTEAGFDVDFAASKFSSRLVEAFITNVSRLSAEWIECREGNRYVIPHSQWLRSDAVFRELIVD